jgi:hypothetical protein
MVYFVKANGRGANQQDRVAVAGDTSLGSEQRQSTQGEERAVHTHYSKDQDAILIARAG